MNCPSCGSPRSKVLKTEIILKNKVRRRVCSACNYYFSTIETVVFKTSRFTLKNTKEK